MTKNLNVKVPEELLEKAREAAKEKDVTVSQVVRKALRELIEDDPPEDEDT